VVEDAGMLRKMARSLAVTLVFAAYVLLPVYTLYLASYTDNIIYNFEDGSINEKAYYFLLVAGSMSLLMFNALLNGIIVYILGYKLKKLYAKISAIISTVFLPLLTQIILDPCLILLRYQGELPLIRPFSMLHLFFAYLGSIYGYTSHFEDGCSDRIKLLENKAITVSKE